MDRSRSKRYYYDQDYESETLHSRSKPRYSSNSHGGGGNHYVPSFPRRASAGGGGGRKMQDQSMMVTTSYRILCHDVKAGGVIGKSGSIIKAIRQHTGAWINVHELIPGDEERIIEISDTRRRDPDGRLPAFSPAQEALFLIHDRILETEMSGYGHNAAFGDELNDEYGNRGGGNGIKMVTRLVVSRIHVGCLLGKGGKIIEQMRIETKTHIRVLPRDHTLPRCVAMSEEIVQVVGEMNAVKNAIAIISSRLRESQHRDRSHFNNRLLSPDRFGMADDDFHLHNTARKSAEGPNFGQRYSAGQKSNKFTTCSSGYAFESGPAPVSDNGECYSGDSIVFRILCPVEKIDCIIGESDGIVELLQTEIGVNVDVEPVTGSDEHIIIISSDEGPDDELFPAQEALLHIQTRIVDIIPENENVITTRLLLQSAEIGCLAVTKDGSRSILDIGEMMGAANVEILPREKIPAGVQETDEIVQIVGEIKAAREVLIELTSRVRSYIYGEFLERDALTSPAPVVCPEEENAGPESASSNNITPSIDKHHGNGSLISTNQTTSTTAALQKVKDFSATIPNDIPRREDTPSLLNRISVPIVTRSTLEVVIPPHTASKLKSKKLALISELSGATVKLIEDRPESTEKIIQISGTPDQAEKAQSLLQGFILSTEEDGP